MPRLVIHLQEDHVKNPQKAKRKVLEYSSRVLTQAFSCGLVALNKRGRAGAFSKSSRTLQHLLNKSALSIFSEENLDGSSRPSYLNPGCILRYSGYTRRPRNE